MDGEHIRLNEHRSNILDVGIDDSGTIFATLSKDQLHIYNYM
jgi:hypothetical protein